MELNGERVLPVERSIAWQALNDTEVLKAAVPGCESITPVGDSVYEVAVNAAIGPVKSRFKGRLELQDIVAPSSYAVRFDLQGPAGFARGTAKVSLSDAESGTTLMKYEVNTSIGGKIAQIGSRLVDAAAATMTDRFFAVFAAQLAERYPQASIAPSAARPPGFFSTVMAFLRRLFAGKS
ncbi:MAG: SRPBCC family protein [Burkholderiaceae bacterium]